MSSEPSTAGHQSVSSRKTRTLALAVLLVLADLWARTLIAYADLPIGLQRANADVAAVAAAFQQAL